MKTCKICNQHKEIACFSPGRSVCKSCRNSLLRDGRKRPCDDSSSKICSKCRAEKPIGLFKRDRSRKDGYRPECKSCTFAKTRIVTIDNDKKLCASCNQWKNFDKFNRDSTNKHGISGSCKECKSLACALHPKKNFGLVKQIKCSRCQYCLDVSEYKSARSTICRECQRIKRNIGYSKWYSNKIKTDPAFHLRRTIQASIKQSLRYHLVVKNMSTTNILFEHLQYSVIDLRIHLESQFDANMSWGNYGKYWHIDHIVPQSIFDIRKIGDEEFNRCWSLDNLRPLEAKANISKGNSISHNKWQGVDVVQEGLGAST